MNDNGFTIDAVPGLSACETPIEGKLLQAMFDSWNFITYYELYQQPKVRPKRCCIFEHRHGTCGVMIQVEMDDLPRRRIDFLIESFTTRFIVEVDGLKYHSDKNTMCADRSKDRRALLAGYTTLRFAGPEVWSSPKLAIEQIEQTCKKFDDEKWPIFLSKLDAERAEVLGAA